MKHWGVLAGLAIAALIIVGLEYGVPWWESRGAVEPEPGVVTTEPAPAASTDISGQQEVAFQPRPIPPNLPSLDESDESVSEALAGWPVEPEWLEQGDLLRRLAALIDNAALGEVPRKQLAFLLPGQGFSVVSVDGELQMSERSFARFDAYLDLLEAYPTDKAATFLVLYAPLLDAALRELGRPDADSLALVRRSVANVTAVSIPEDGLALARTDKGYVFADPAIEAASELDKQLLRLGPDNLARLQRYAREVVAELEAGEPLAGR